WQEPLDRCSSVTMRRLTARWWAATPRVAATGCSLAERLAPMSDPSNMYRLSSHLMRYKNMLIPTFDTYRLLCGAVLSTACAAGALLACSNGGSGGSSNPEGGGGQVTGDGDTSGDGDS